MLEKRTGEQRRQQTGSHQGSHGPSQSATQGKYQMKRSAALELVVGRRLVISPVFAPHQHISNKKSSGACLPSTQTTPTSAFRRKSAAAAPAESPPSPPRAPLSSRPAPRQPRIIITTTYTLPLHWIVEPNPTHPSPLLFSLPLSRNT